uniref:BED-type domain-containing protein n=1 Tax=Leptobrachium leishanense TaxID=445787 RepID=A0A8C5MP76_9ANUR
MHFSTGLKLVIGYSFAPDHRSGARQVQLQCSDSNSEVEEGSIINLEEGSAKESREEEAAQQKRGRMSSMANRSQSKTSEVKAAQVQSAVVSKHMYRKSAVWEFFKKCAADHTVAICNLCQVRIKRAKDSPCLGTTCLRRHMTTCHASCWHNTLHRSSSSVSTPTICPAMSLFTTSTDSDDATVMAVSRSQKKCVRLPLALRGRTFVRPNFVYCPSLNTCRNSAVWEFFKKCAADPTVAICNLCQRRLKRGINTGHLGTTCLRRHMNKCHPSRWGKTLRRSSSSSSVSTHTVCPAMQLPTTSTDRDDATVMDVPAGPSSQCDIIPVAEDLRSQITLPQLLQRKKKYSLNHPQAQRLNANLAKLLALQLLPFQLVDFAPFREFAECAVPQWQVPKHHYFSRKAIPALYQHVEDNVIQSLGKAVSSKVHVTLDTWSSKHGSFTAHWVTLIAAGRDPRWAKRCHTVLELVCLGDRSHTGSEILSALQGQVQRWFTPRQLELGMIVCNNGSNLLSALRKGKLTHVSCLAHVLNLVAQRFLTKYPGLPELLIQARKVYSHFRQSFPASVRLAEIQREFHLPTNRLICDMPTRWNSTLAMLHTCVSMAQGQVQVNLFFFPQQWLMIKDACTVLSPFEEATTMVSRDKTEGLVRGWEEEVPDTVILIDQEDSAANATSNLRCMGTLMMQSLLKDPRIRAIKERDHYWLATLLDPRYKGKVAELILPAQRDADTRASEAAGDQRNSGEGQGRLTDAFLIFFSPRRPGTSNVGTHCQRLHHMVQDYLGVRADLDTFPADDPLAYWVLRLDHWPEFSQYAMQLLGCPSSSVLSERTFSAAGGFVTDKRVRLSTDSVDRLTFIKMNQSWISSYQSPDAEVTE